MSVKYHPASFVVYLFSPIGTKIDSKSGFTSLASAEEWAIDSVEEDETYVILRVIKNSAVDYRMEFWGYELDEDETGL